MKVHHLFESTQTWTAEKVVFDILGDLVTSDPNEDENPNSLYKYSLGRSWTGYPLFSDFDSDDYGAIGLLSLRGSSPIDIAQAAHESFHAYLHHHGKNHNNEHLVNKLTIHWLRTHLREPQLSAALKVINQSKESYAKFRYQPSRQGKGWRTQ